MVWYWHQNRQVDQWYRIEDMDTNPNKYNFLILDKVAKNMQWRKDSPSTNGAGKTGNPYAAE